jgi:hypothetical protein
MGLAASLRRRVAYGVGVLALVTSFAAASAGKADAQVPSLGYCEIAAIAFNYNLQEYDWDGGRHGPGGMRRPCTAAGGAAG